MHLLIFLCLSALFWGNSYQAEELITFSAFNDTDCATLVYSVTLTEGECGTNPYSNYSAILTTLTNNTVNDTSFMAPNCTGQPGSVVYQLETCIAGGDGKNPEIVAFTLTSQTVLTTSIVATTAAAMTTSSPTSGYTFSAYNDTDCEVLIYSLTGQQGVCNNNPYTNFSGILIIQGNLVNDKYFLSLNCTGAPLQASYGLDNCTIGGDGKNPNVLAVRYTLAVISTTAATTGSMNLTTGSMNATTGPMNATTGVMSTTGSAPAAQFIYTTYNDTNCVNVVNSFSGNQGVCVNDPFSAYSAIIVVTGSVVNDTYYAGGNCTGAPLGNMIFQLNNCTPVGGANGTNIVAAKFTLAPTTTGAVTSAAMTTRPVTSGVMVTTAPMATTANATTTASVTTGEESSSSSSIIEFSIYLILLLVLITLIF